LFLFCQIRTKIQSVAACSGGSAELASSINCQMFRVLLDSPSLSSSPASDSTGDNSAVTAKASFATLDPQVFADVAATAPGRGDVIVTDSDPALLLTDDMFPRQVVPRIAPPAPQLSRNSDSDGAVEVVMHSVATTVRMPRADDYMHDLGTKSVLDG
jgi:hypothetical protein